MNKKINLQEATLLALRNKKIESLDSKEKYGLDNIYDDLNYIFGGEGEAAAEANLKKLRNYFQDLAEYCRKSNETSVNGTYIDTEMLLEIKSLLDKSIDLFETWNQSVVE